MWTVTESPDFIFNNINLLSEKASNELNGVLTETHINTEELTHNFDNNLLEYFDRVNIWMI